MTVDVAVVGATGAVGQRFVSLLDGHPTFRVAALVASERSAGKTYGEAATWVLDEPMPPWAREMEVLSPDGSLPVRVVFSAVPSGTALGLEAALAKRGVKVFSNAKDHRMDADVPLLIPEVNAEHAALVKRQPGPGFIVTNGNCTGIVLTLSLAPLFRAFGVERVLATSMQAVSGAGYPGVPSLDILGNVIPHIGGEEAKLEDEPRKVLGSLDAGGVTPAAFPISATCTRVPVEEGHTIAVHLALGRAAAEADVLRAWRGFTGEPQRMKLPLAPERPVLVAAAADRPQPRRDWRAGRAMSVTVGRLRKDPVLGANGWKYVVSGSNTVRGAAGGSILNAEYFQAKGLL